MSATDVESRDGIDGLWSSFSLRTGTPGQVSRVLPSTAGSAVWVIHPEGCEPSPYTVPTCAHDRGGVFHSNASKTWISQGNFGLGIELNLGPKFSTLGGAYGLDTVALAEGNATGGPSLGGQLVAEVGSILFYTGMFGLNNQPSNETNFDDPIPSYLTTLKTKNLIPSLSWAYTAGASYRKCTIPLMRHLLGLFHRVQILLRQAFRYAVSEPNILLLIRNIQFNIELSSNTPVFLILRAN